VSNKLIKGAIIIWQVSALIFLYMLLAFTLRLLISEKIELKVKNYQAPTYQVEEKLRWKFLLYEEVIKSGKTYRDFLILREIAKAETNFEHYKNGKVIRGTYNKNDVGIFQINELYHKEKAQKMGLDIEKVEDNIRFAVWLYTQKGTSPWIWSKNKWSRNISKL